MCRCLCLQRETTVKIPKEIISEINNRLNKHHKMYSLPVSGLFWEEVLYRALKRCGYNAEWEPGSHKTEEDIESKEIGSISCKGGLIRVGCNTIIIDITHFSFLTVKRLNMIV